MARDILATLNAAIFSHRRSPAFRILVYDVLSTSDTISDIVLGNELDEDTGPRDFTDDCVQVQFTEQGGDYIDSGVAASQIVVDIVDPNNRFDPFHVLVAPDGDGRWLREGNVVQILEGDENVDEEDWVYTFTGRIVGQAGVDRRRTANTARISFKALSREADFLPQVNTTASYPDGTSYLSIAEDVANTDMGLALGEIDFPTIGSRVTHLTTTQFVKESPLVTLAHLFFPDLYMPRFDGTGKLTATSGIVTQAPVRVYEDEQAGILVGIVRPYHDEKRVNAVRVVGLDSGLVKVLAPRQELATLVITTGYFAHDEREPVYWSEDHTLLAESVTMRVLRSVSGGLTPLGGEEGFDLVAAPNVDEEGSIGAVVRIGTGFAPYLLVWLLIDYIQAAAIPDSVTLVETIPVGRVIEAVVLVAACIVMTMIGRGSYQFIGEPFQYVHREIRAEARQTGITEATRSALEIKNHLVTSQSLANDLARDLLFRRASMSALRSVEMLTDLRLEPDDVFEYKDRRYLVSAISRTLQRDGEGIASLTCYEVTPGVYA